MLDCADIANCGRFESGGDCEQSTWSAVVPMEPGAAIEHGRFGRTGLSFVHGSIGVGFCGELGAAVFLLLSLPEGLSIVFLGGAVTFVALETEGSGLCPRATLVLLHDGHYLGPMRGTVGTAMERMCKLPLIKARSRKRAGDQARALVEQKEDNGRGRTGTVK